jgi:hypothetical protein
MGKNEHLQTARALPGTGSSILYNKSQAETYSPNMSGGCLLQDVSLSTIKKQKALENQS